MDLHNAMIKPSNNGWLENIVYAMTQKLLTRYTTLRSFSPSQVWKTTPRLHQTYRCEICIISKDMHIGLNIFRTILVIYLP